jgi:iron-sulfur cluster protein
MWNKILEHEDFQTLRQKIHEMKEQSIANLPRLVSQFKDAATNAGAIVYEAKDAEDANEYILKLVQARDVKKIVKSKSMLTEEIKLRENLENGGIKVTETDIGEWIVQLAGEKPVHSLIPAMHKPIEEIAVLFSKATGKELEPDPILLLNTARNVLRQSYFDADMGITGVNIAIANSGTIVTVTNEGNASLITTVPPIHVAIMGYEKIVPGFDEANLILRLLSRNLMDIKMAAYTSFITGTSYSYDSSSNLRLPGQGPGEVHIILVDNGRLLMRESTEFKEALYCIRCGACINACPVFAAVAGHTYGHIWQGGIGTILTAFVDDKKKARQLSGLCLGCSACKEVCSAKIDIPRMIRQIRIDAANEKIPLMNRVIYRCILKKPRVLDSLIRIGYYLQKPFVDKDNLIRKLPYPLNKITRVISLPALARHPARKMMGSKDVEK